MSAGNRSESLPLGVSDPSRPRAIVSLSTRRAVRSPGKAGDPARLHLAFESTPDETFLEECAPSRVSKLRCERSKLQQPPSQTVEIEADLP